jgi:hypothetical protein
MRWRFSDRIKQQMAAFISGFAEFIPQDLLRVFDENEVEVGLLIWLILLDRFSCETNVVTQWSIDFLQRFIVLLTCSYFLPTFLLFPLFNFPVTRHLKKRARGFDDSRTDETSQNLRPQVSSQPSV